MKNLLKRKKQLFDGDDNPFYSFSCLVDVPGGGQLRFDNQQPCYLGELGEKRADEVVSLIGGAKKIVDFPGDTPSYKQGNLALHCQRAVDERSGSSFLIVVAGGELQPARYALYLAGLFADA